MDQKPKDVPYIVYESTQAKNERTTKRIIITLVIAVCLLFMSNMLWLYAWTMYDYESTEDTQDGQGINLIGDRNEVNNHGSDVKDTGTEKKEEIR
jgi:hypothetical protein